MKSSDLSNYISVQDHSVSGERFDLKSDRQGDILMTYPQPPLDQLGKYYESDDYISHTDGKRSMFEKLYHFIKGIALKNKLLIVNSNTSAQKELLDIGAGTGDFLSTAQKGGWNGTGVEPSDKARAIAQKKGVRLIEKSEGLQDHTYDAISMWHVLEHVPSPEAQVTELKRLLKADGTLFIAVPNFKSHDAQYYQSFWAAYDVPRHLWHFSQGGIKRLFAAEGMEVVKILPMKFDAFYVSLLSEKYKTGKMNYASAFFNGWNSNRKAKQSGEYSSLIYVIKNSKTQNKAV